MRKHDVFSYQSKPLGETIINRSKKTCQSVMSENPITQINGKPRVNRSMFISITQCIGAQGYAGRPSRTREIKACMPLWERFEPVDNQMQAKTEQASPAITKAGRRPSGSTKYPTRLAAKILPRDGEKATRSAAQQDPEA